MATRLNPFEEIEQFFNRMSRQFEETSRELDSTEPFSSLQLGSRAMAVDVVEDGETIVVTADLPGFEREEVDVRVSDHTLRISAEREETIDETEGERYLRHERRHQSTSRSIQLPSEVDKDNVEARMKHGVLSITLPKREMEEAREIDIDIE